VNDDEEVDHDDDREVPRDFLRHARFFRETIEQHPELLSTVAAIEGFSVRTARYLASIDRAYRNLRVPRHRLISIGWTKLAMLADVVDQKNCLELLTLAESFTVQELALILRGREPVEGTRCVLLYLTPPEYAVFETAIVAHGGTRTGRGLFNKEAALIKALSKLVEP
jgi:hypothetical protein